MLVVGLRVALALGRLRLAPVGLPRVILLSWWVSLLQCYSRHCAWPAGPLVLLRHELVCWIGGFCSARSYLSGAAVEVQYGPGVIRRAGRG